MGLGLAIGTAAIASHATQHKHEHSKAAKPVFHAGGSVIRVGAVVAATGTHAYEGRATREGYEFWSSWVNRHGGVQVGNKRYRIELIERDDESNPLLTTQIVERIIDEEQVEFLLGPYGSPETLAAAAVAERKGIPLIIGTGASEKIFQQGYHQVFGVMSPARVYLRGIVGFARHAFPPVKTAAIVASNDSFSLEAQQGALQRAHDLGITVVASDRYHVGTLNFSALASRLAMLKPDMILNAGHVEESIALTRSLYDMNVHAKIYGQAVGAEIPAFAYFLGALSDDTLSAAQWTETGKSRGTGSFFVNTAPAYAHAFMHFAGHQAGSENASASAAGLALELALHNAGSRNPQRVRKSLAALRAATFYGTIKFDARGVNSAKPMLINQLEVGKLLTISPRNNANAEVVYPARDWRNR